MSGKNYEQMIRESESLFENAADYSNPFRGLGRPVDRDTLRESLKAPAPIDSASKPEFPGVGEEDDKDATAPNPPEETDSDDEESSEEEDGESDNEGSATVPLVENNSAQLPVARPLPEDKPKEQEPTPGVPDVVDSSENRPPQTPPRSDQSASRGPGEPVTAKKDRDRRSSELSPFSNTHQRKPSVTLKPGSNPASVRTGGVTSPPPSDAASIARERLDEEDALSADDKDPEELMDMVRTSKKNRNVPPKDKKPAKGPQLRASTLSVRSGNLGSIETVVASNHEVRIASLEGLVKDLLEQNQTLATKTDLLIKELSGLRSELIREMNEKMKRVGGPVPSLTVTSSSPVVGPGEAPVPSNVVSTGSALSSLAPAAPVGPSGLTGNALVRYNMRLLKRQQGGN